MTATVLQKKARPTNLDLQEQIAETHSCVHQVGAEVKDLAKTVRQDRHDAKNRDQGLDARLSALDTRLAKQEASTDLLVKFFRLDKGQPKPGIGSLTWWQAAVGIGCSVIGSLAGWKYLFLPMEAGIKAAIHAYLGLH